MAALDVIVEKLVALWRVKAVRHNFPWSFLLISIVGSLLKELELIPQSYFSSSKNLLNVYFVKISWGWTLTLLTPFLLLSYSSFSSVTFLVRRLLSLVVATGVWYVITETFSYIEDLSGSCFESRNMDVINMEFSTKSSCRHAGFLWKGYDISGHSFILSYSALVIMEETALMAFMKTANLSALARMAVNVLYVALNLIIFIWVWMFTCTSVYFHEFFQKIFGTIFGLLCWYMTYKVWYLKPLSPGLPPQRHSKEQKQHA